MNKKMFVSQSDKLIETEPIMDFKSGYVQRAIRSGNLPKQGTEAPWKLKQNFIYDALTLNYGKIKDGYLKFF